MSHLYSMGRFHYGSIINLVDFNKIFLSLAQSNITESCGLNLSFIYITFEIEDF